MKHYCVFAIGTDGRVFTRIDLYCASEEEAKARAQHFTSQYDAFELWQGSRKIEETKRLH